jgi:hypothetical protein
MAVRHAGRMLNTMQISQPDSTDVNSLFAAYESDAADPDADGTADALASSVFRFMMLDEGLLAHSLRSARDSRS